ncbi:MAG: hypothetical protein KAG66_03390, partial [Methylococcales bacterium]|nr:hypothetical protein [Methylococcales bacterium]
KSLELATNAAMQLATKSATINAEASATRADTLKKVIDAQIALATLEGITKDVHIKEFTLEQLMPLDREQKKENIEQTHVEHQKSTYELTTLLPLDKLTKIKQNTLLDDEHDHKAYNLATLLPQTALEMTATRKLREKELAFKTYEFTNMLPLEKAKLIAENDFLAVKELEMIATRELKEKELEFKVYEFTNMLPLQKAKLLAEKDLTAVKALEAQTQKEIADIDKLIKTYYRTYMQPEEKKQLAAKATIEYINSGAGVAADSLPIKRMTLLDKQDEVYDEQIKQYQTQKDQEIVKLVANYHSMVYPDLNGTAQALLGFATPTSADAAFTRLNTV